VLLLFFFCVISQCFLLNKGMKSSSRQDDLKKIWADLFSKPKGGNCKAVTAQAIESQQSTEAQQQADGATWSGPRKKSNIYEKQQGYGSSAYFFDYIDEMFQAEVTKAFQAVFDEVKKTRSGCKRLR